MRETLYNATIARQSLAPATRTASATGASADRMSNQGSFRSVHVVISVGDAGAGTHTFVLEESDDSTTWGAPAPETVQGSMPVVSASNENSIFEVGYVGHARYLRVRVAVTGATLGGGLYSATIHLGWPRVMPVLRDGS